MADVTPGITTAFQEAVREAEELIAHPPFEVSEQDLAEGYDYLAGSIRSSLQMAFDYDLEHPVLINPTHQYARQGLDNPDAVYFNAYLDAGATYVVSGTRGTTADLSFQVMDGTYSDSGAPNTLAAFDDRELEVADDGSFEWRFGPELGLKKGSTLIVREVYDDWNTEQRGTIRIQRLDTAGQPRGPLTPERVAKRYGVAAKMLTGRIKTWFAFPEWFTYKEPVNTLTAPQSTPGGLSSQFSSIGHYSLADDEALVVTVPVSESAYQAIQVGSRWYVSTDYEHHQTALNKSQSQADPDGRLPLRDQRARPRHRELARALRPPPGRDDAALATARARTGRLGRPERGGGALRVRLLETSLLRRQPGHPGAVRRPHRGPPGRHRPPDDLVSSPTGGFVHAPEARAGNCCTRIGSTAYRNPPLGVLRRTEIPRSAN